MTLSLIPILLDSIAFPIVTTPREDMAKPYWADTVILVFLLCLLGRKAYTRYNRDGALHLRSDRGGWARLAVLILAAF